MDLRSKCLLIAMLCCPFIALAQKLPHVQQSSMRAPANVKIDGKTVEWGELKAYNKATQVDYSIANDDEYLYMVVKTSLPEIMDKIINGGVTLTINERSKTKGKLLPAITFPMFNDDPRLWLNWGSKPIYSPNTIDGQVAVDSFARAKNSMLAKYMKWVGTLNVRGVKDSIISVYNDEGIKVAYAVDNELSFNYELAIPLKCIGLSSLHKRFFYNIQLNGLSIYYTSIEEPRPGLYLVTRSDGRTGVMGRGDSPTKIYPTDFWGEYTLVK